MPCKRVVSDGKSGEGIGEGLRVDTYLFIVLVLCSIARVKPATELLLMAVISFLLQLACRLTDMFFVWLNLNWCLTCCHTLEPRCPHSPNKFILVQLWVALLFYLEHRLIL